MDDTDHDEGFFHDVSEDLGAHIQSKSSHDDSAPRSRRVKLKKVKKFVCKKSKGPKMKKSLVKPPKSVKASLHVRSGIARDKIIDITPDPAPDHNCNQAADSLKPNDIELKSSKVQTKKVKVKYGLDSPKKKDKVILDLTNKHQVEDLENFINNNNHTKETQTTSSTGLPGDNLPNRSSRKELDTNRGQVERTNKETVLQFLSAWEEKASRYPEMRQEIIVDVTLSSGELYFIVDWDGDRWKVKAEEAYRRIPMTCLNFYERLLVWDTS